MERHELMDVMWSAAEPNLYITKEVFVANFDGWDVREEKHDGMPIAIVVERGPELHFQALGRPIPRRIVRSVVQKIIDRYGYAVTKTPVQELRQQRFNERIGFEVTGRDEYDVHYRIERIRGLGSRG